MCWHGVEPAGLVIRFLRFLYSTMLGIIMVEVDCKIATQIGEPTSEYNNFRTFVDINERLDPFPLWAVSVLCVRWFGNAGPARPAGPGIVKVLSGVGH